MGEPGFIAEYNNIYGGFLERARALIVEGYWHLKENRLDHKIKAEDFSHVQSAAEQVVDALQTFIETAEGDRGRTGVQPYINKILSTINIHLDRVTKYYPKNNPQGYRTKDHKREEGKFQQAIFKGEQKIKSKLKQLNIENDMDNLQVDFFDKVVATIPMRKVLMKRNDKLKAKIESLEVDWDLILNNGIFINMKKRDVPYYNSEKHFWDQEPESLQFWVSEYNKIVKGYTVDGYKMTGSLYFQINFFKTPIKSKNNEITNAPLRDNEWYVDEAIKYAEEKAKKLERSGVLIWGTRRFSKTTQEVSRIHHGILVYPTETGTASSSNAEDLESIVDKLKKSLDYIVSPFRLNILSGKGFDTKDPVMFGIKSKSGRESYEHFSLRIINTDSGSKKGSQKTAGGNPKVFIADEIGKSLFIKMYEAAIPSFESDEGWVCIPLLSGTGGDEDLSRDAEKVLSNPTNHGVLEMDWNILEYKVPKDAITWNRRPFGWFMPAQMSTYTGMRKIKTNLADFLDIESEELKKIDFWVTDWVYNTNKIKEIRSKLTGTALTSEKVFRPIDPEECFISAKSNPYPATGIKRHKERLQSEGDNVYGLGRKIELFRNQEDSNKIEYELSSKEINEYPHDGKYTNCAGLLFDDFPETKPYDIYRYVAGCLLPGEKVYTEKGLMNVEDITFENKLINKEGNLVDILALQRHEKIDEDTYTIKVGNTFRETTFTKEHPIYVSRPELYEVGKSKGRTKNFKFGEESFKKAKDLRKGDWVKYPNIYKKTKKIAYKELWNEQGIKPNTIIENPLKNKDFWLFLGTYMGDGCVLKHKIKYSINVCFGAHEKLHIENYINIVAKVFKRSASQRRRGNKVEVEFTCKQLYFFLKKHFGEKAGGKYLPEWVKYAKKEYKYELLCGYLNSDGCMMNLPNGYLMSKYVSISLRLLEDFQDILFSLGLTSSLTKLRDEKLHYFPQGYYSMGKKTYMLQMNQIDSIKLCENFREGKSMKMPKIKRELNNTIKSKNGCFLSEDSDYIYFRIKGIRKSSFTGTVYNFECDTNTFLTHHITTHNCDDYKQDQSDGDSIGSFMIFDRLKRKIVYSLATRPDPHKDFFKEMHMALDAWNAKCFMENEDMDFKKYLDAHPTVTAQRYLYEAFDPYGNFSKFQNGTRKFGWRPDVNSVPTIRGYILDYVKDDLELVDDNGNVTSVVGGYERIEDIQLLEEMIKYKPGGNYDRLVSFGSCLAIDFYLTSNYKTPQSNTKRTDEQLAEQFIPKPTKSKYYTTKRRRLF